MVSSSLGAGVLSLPKAFAIWGLLGGIFMETFAAFNSLISLNIMCKIAAKHQNCKLYTDLVQVILGNNSRKVFNIFMMVYLFGAIVAYSLTAN